MTVVHFLKWKYFDPIEFAADCVAPLVNPIELLRGRGAEYPVKLLILDLVCYCFIATGAIFVWRKGTRGRELQAGGSGPAK
jgi:hypothetical protein